MPPSGYAPVGLGPRKATRPAGRRLCLAVRAGATLGFLGAAALAVVALVATPGWGSFPLGAAVFAVELFRHRFERRLAPRPDVPGRRLGVRGGIVVTAVIIGLIGFIVLADVISLAFHLNTTAWNQRGAAATLMAQFIMLYVMARKALRARG
jgi:hypothetical protein